VKKVNANVAIVAIAMFGGLLVSTQPASAAVEFASTVNTQISPGGGGTNSMRDCSAISKEILVGISAGLAPFAGNDILTQLAGRCDTTTGETRSGTTSELAKTIGSSYWGSSSPIAGVSTAECPANQVVVGARIYKSTGTTSLIRAVQLKCGNLPSGSGANWIGTTIGDNTGTSSEEIQCEVGTIAIGLSINDGSVVDQFGIRCKAMKIFWIAPDTLSVSYGDASPTYSYSFFKFVSGGVGTPATDPGVVGLSCASSYSSSAPLTPAGSTLQISCTGTPPSGYTQENFVFLTSQLSVVQRPAPTISYNGSAVVPLGSKVNLEIITSGTGPCPDNLYQYVFEGNGQTYVWPSSGGTIASAQQQTTSTLGISSDSIYTVRVNYVGDSNCSSSTSSGEDVLTVYPLGSAAYGGGFYTSNGRSNFGFVVQQVPKSNPAVYKGQIVWNWKNAWRFKGTLNNYGKTSTSGSAAGIGTLEYWDPALNGGIGGWAVAATGVNVNVGFTPTQTTTKKSGGNPGSFVINFGYTTPVGWTLTPLPSLTTLTTLKGGNITLK
jgi:hypothetical protein